MACERLYERKDRWTRIYDRSELLALVQDLTDRYDEVMADTGAIELDGMASPVELAERVVELVLERHPTLSAIADPS